MANPGEIVVVTVKASTELLEQMRDTWSVPVQVTATEGPDGHWEMTFRRAVFED